MLIPKLEKKAQANKANSASNRDDVKNKAGKTPPDLLKEFTVF